MCIVIYLYIHVLMYLYLISYIHKINDSSINGKRNTKTSKNKFKKHHVHQIYCNRGWDTIVH